MQLELFIFDEIKDCFASSVNCLLRQSNEFLKRLDSRFNYVLDCWKKCSEAYQDFYWSHVSCKRGI